MSHFRKPKLTANKLVSMKEAIADTVKPGCNLYIEGFTHLISFAAGHEIIRQQIKDITAIRLTPDLVYDQLIEAKLVKKLREWEVFMLFAAFPRRILKPRSRWKNTPTSVWWLACSQAPADCRSGL